MTESSRTSAVYSCSINLKVIKELKQAVVQYGRQSTYVKGLFLGLATEHRLIPYDGEVLTRTILEANALLKFIFFLIFNVMQLQLSASYPHPSTPPRPNPPPSPNSTLPLDFVHVSFIVVVPVIPSPHCPLPTPP